MKPSLHILEWDSHFFNFNVARIGGFVINAQDIAYIEEMMAENDIKLAYCSGLAEMPLLLKTSNTFEAYLVDKKITYVKEVNANFPFHTSIKSADEHSLFRSKLIDLAIQSGAYSRFNVDKRIGKENFERMYALWMNHSLSRIIAKEVLIYTEGNDLMGFVTLGEKNHRADIGIIAVDHHWRGKGIGKTLITHAEKWFAEKGYRTMQVVTQCDNLPARKLYESCDYSIDIVEYFYHIWKK